MLEAFGFNAPAVEPMQQFLGESILIVSCFRGVLDSVNVASVAEMVC